MLKDTFFSIKDSVDVENGRNYRIALNDAHPIFQAHFAGNPIIPGACVMQLIKELATNYFKRHFFAGTVKNMKFLQVINPLESPEISVKLVFTQLETGRISVASELSDKGKIFSKSMLILENDYD